MNLGIKGKAAVVTGGDSGIGFATAKILAEAGANVILTDKSNEELKAAAAQLQSMMKDGQSAFAFTADIRKNEDVLSLAQVAKEKFGRIAILAHCAGTRGAAGDFLDLSDDDWQQTIDVDLLGTVRICRAFLPGMIEHNDARIVLIASENALQPYEAESPYNACKAAIINLTKCLSRAYSPQGVRINCVSPAFIATPMTDAMMEEKAKQENRSKEAVIQEFLKEERPHIVVDRRGTPEEVAAVIAFLCSSHASYITGSNYRVDGGSVESAFG